MQTAEQSTIGCLLLDPSLLPKAQATLTPIMFENEALARIYSCMGKLEKAGLPVDAVTVISKLGDEYKELVMLCAETVPSLSGFDGYCNLVLDGWRERDLLRTMQELLISGMTADEICGDLEKLLQKQRHIADHLHSKSEATFLEAVGEAYQNLWRPDTSLKTEWGQFNRVMGGLQRGGLYIIAARPGDGKTDYSIHLAVQLAKHYKVDYRSLEMTKEQLVHRVLSRVCMINSTLLRDHKVTDEEAKLIGYAVDKMKDIQLTMDDTAGISVDDVEAKLDKDKPDIMFIDYLGLMHSDDNGKKPLWQITGEITHKLKALAQKHNAAIVALVQMGRAADKTTEPTLSDLKGGSDIEADADGVLFVRPEKTDTFLEGNEAWPCDIIVAKNRHGGTGRLRYLWQPQYHNYTPVEERRTE